MRANSAQEMSHAEVQDTFQFLQLQVPAASDLHSW